MELIVSIIKEFGQKLIENLGNILTSIATICSVFIASYLTRKISIEDRFWQMRRQVYSSMIANISIMKRSSGYAYAFYRDGGDYSSDEMYRDKESEVFDHFIKFRDTFTDNSIVLSDDFLRFSNEFIGEYNIFIVDGVSKNRNREKYELIKKYSLLLNDIGRREISGINRKWYSKLFRKFCKKAGPAAPGV